jgi:hypothetical protein
VATGVGDVPQAAKANTNNRITTAKYDLVCMSPIGGPPFETNINQGVETNRQPLQEHVPPP